MKKTKSLYHGHRFPASVISHAVRWYFRFQLSLHNIKELLFERGVVVSHESIRRWIDKFGAGFAHRAKAARRPPSTTWHPDEVFVSLRGEPYVLWRAVDQHGIAPSRPTDRLPADTHRSNRYGHGGAHDCNQERRPAEIDYRLYRTPQGSPLYA